MRRNIQGSNRFRRKFFGDIPFSNLKTPLLYVDDINAKEVSDTIRSIQPEFILVMGTSILRRDVLSAAESSSIINIHGGYLPFYKGNHCFFFALYNRDYDRIGSTIHFINKCVDTDPIICHVIPDITTTDTAESLYCKADKETIK